jgi:hypothetical protein
MAELMHFCGGFGFLNNGRLDLLLQNDLLNQLSLLGLSLINHAGQLSLQKLLLRFFNFKILPESSEALSVSIIKDIEIKHLLML